MLKFNRFKSINLGDFNATMGMDSLSNGAWDNILGANTSSIVKPNANGELQGLSKKGPSGKFA